MAAAVAAAGEDTEVRCLCDSEFDACVLCSPFSITHVSTCFIVIAKVAEDEEVEEGMVAEEDMGAVETAINFLPRNWGRYS